MDELSSLYSHDYQGKVTMAYLQHVDLKAAGFLLLHDLVSAQLERGLDGVHFVDALLDRLQLPLWHGTGHSVQSVFCLGAVELVGASTCCVSCARLSSALLSSRARSTAQRMQALELNEDHQSVVTFSGVREVDMSAVELRAKSAFHAHKRELNRVITRNVKRSKCSVDAKLAAVTQHLIDAGQADDQPRFLQFLVRAHEEGMLEDRKVRYLLPLQAAVPPADLNACMLEGVLSWHWLVCWPCRQTLLELSAVCPMIMHCSRNTASCVDAQALVAMLEGIGEALVHGERHRRLNGTQKAFYCMLMSYGGPLVAQAVSKVPLAIFVSSLCAFKCSRLSLATWSHD